MTEAPGVCKAYADDCTNCYYFYGAENVLKHTADINSEKINRGQKPDDHQRYDDFNDMAQRRIKKNFPDFIKVFRKYQRDRCYCSCFRDEEHGPSAKKGPHRPIGRLEIHVRSAGAGH